MTRHIFVFFLFALFPLIAAVPVFGAEGGLCGQALLDSAIQEYYQDQALTEEGLLAAVDPSQLDPMSIRSLNSTHGVFEMKDPQGHQFVVRVAGRHLNDVVRERFATTFARKVPGISVPATRSLTAHESEILLRKYKDARPAEYRQLKPLFTKGAGETEGTLLSLTMLMPGKVGFDVLEGSHVSDVLFDNFIEFALSRHRGSPEGSSDFFRYHWKGASQDSRSALVESLRGYFPVLKMAGDSQVLDLIINNISYFSAVALGDLFAKRLRRLDPLLIPQLASLWVVYTVLRISDFHWKNWLLFGKTVIGIDLALPQHTGTSQNGHDPLVISNQAHPFGGFVITDDIRHLLLHSVLPEVRGYLRTLDQGKLRAIAREAEYPIDDTEADSIMASISSFVGPIR